MENTARWVTSISFTSLHPRALVLGYNLAFERLVTIKVDQTGCLNQCSVEAPVELVWWLVSETSVCIPQYSCRRPNGTFNTEWLWVVMNPKEPKEAVIKLSLISPANIDYSIDQVWSGAGWASSHGPEQQEVCLCCPETSSKALKRYTSLFVHAVAFMLASVTMAIVVQSTHPHSWDTRPIGSAGCRACFYVSHILHKVCVCDEHRLYVEFFLSWCSIRGGASMLDVPSLVPALASSANICRLRQLEPLTQLFYHDRINLW